MGISEQDIELFAARVRLHFEPPLRDAAYALSLPLARVCGARIKDLRPETTLNEIRGWIVAADSPAGESVLGAETLRLLREIGRASTTDSAALKNVYSTKARRATIRLLETVRGRVVLRELLLRRGRTTFREWVESRAHARRSA
jgi:hypothetical protein